MTLLSVLAQAAGAVPSDAGGWLAGGGTAAAAVGAIVWLIRHHAAEMKEAREKFSAELKESREQLSEALERKDEQIGTIVGKFDQALREMRAENQRNVERQFEHSRDVVAALEHVNAALRDLSTRVDVLDGSKPHEVPQQLRTKPPRPGGS